MAQPAKLQPIRTTAQSGAKQPQLKATKPSPEEGKKASPIVVQNEVCSSPIEDPSVVLSAAKERPRNRAIPSESSSLLLEVRERVAAHRASKSRMKTVPLDRQDTAPVIHAERSIDGSSVIYVSSSESSRASSPAPDITMKSQVKGKVANSVSGKKTPKVTTSKGKNKKDQPKMRPPEYAQYIQTEAAAGNLPKRPLTGFKFLDGYQIFYTGGDMRNASETTRARMELIVRYGGTLIPTYDPNVVTHIVTDAPETTTVNALGLKRLRDIPDRIPTVKWSWVTWGIGKAASCTKDELYEKLRDHLWQHAAFSDRLEAGMKATKSFIRAKSKGKGKEKARLVEEGSSPVSDSTQEPVAADEYESQVSANDVLSVAIPTEARPGGLPSPPASQQLGPAFSEASSSRAKLAHDPLAEFYDQAKAEQMKEKQRVVSEAESDEEDVIPEIQPRKRGWTCDNPEAQITDCPNQDVIDKLTELMKLHEAKPSEDDRWRVFAYSKAIRALRSYPRRIRSLEEASKIRGIGSKTAQKIVEILETGKLRRIEYERTGDVVAAALFQGIYGVGRSTAYKWYNAGCRTLDDIRQGKGGVKLSAVQEIGLKYYDDINSRMPREEAKAIYDIIKPIALSLDPKLFVEIMGSYRRGKATCGDIDILITRPTDDGKTHAGVLGRLIQELHAVGVLTEDLALPEEIDDLEGVYRGLCRLPNVPNSKRRRIDFLTVPYHSRGAALIYYTGDDIFNRAMRLKANVMGYSLNQRGLFGNVVRDPRDRRVKLNRGQIIASETEEEIFRILGVPWQEPHERVRG
uniref:DNA polymerase lambda n=1 Tax=Coprinopsis cinerea TaxID=5346 RepID=A0PC13_COPCI|nr:DNA polymerase lambda [Coprinopsis cinerea]